MEREVESASEVQYYSSKEHLLKQSQQSKAYKFVELGKILYDAERKGFVCLHIEGYNKTDYFMRRAPEREAGFECDCQAAQTKIKKGEEPYCSHVLALHYWFSERNKERGWGRYKQERLEE